MGTPATLSCFAVALVLLTIWVLLELRVKHPLINLRVLRSPDALVANLTAITLGTVMYMVLSIGSIIAQAPSETGYGVSLPVFWAGFVMLPFSVGLPRQPSCATSPRSGVDRRLCCRWARLWSQRHRCCCSSLTPNSGKS